MSDREKRASSLAPAASDNAQRGRLAALRRWLVTEASRERGEVARYGIAVAAFLLALALTLTLRSQLESTIFILFWPAVIAAALFGGVGPALFATLLVYPAAHYLLFPPAPAGILLHPSLPVLIVTSACLGWLTQALRSAQLHLLRTRDFLEQAQSSAHLGSWEWNVRTNRVTWSNEMFRVYGFEPGSVDVTYETFLDFVHPDDREMVRAAVETSVRSGEPFAFDYRIVWPDGTVRWLHGRGTVVRDSAGQPIRMTGSGQDITEHRRAGEAQRLLAEASSLLTTSLDYDATLNAVAELAVRSFGDWCSVVIGDETGHHSRVAVAHRDPKRVKWAIDHAWRYPPRADAAVGVARVLRTGEPELYREVPAEMLRGAAESEEHLRLLQELQLHSVMIVPMTARGRRLGAISFVAAESKHRFDPSDLKVAAQLADRAAIAVDNAQLYAKAREAEAIAVDANRAKTEFLAAMSHELRTPLNVLVGYLEVLELGIHGPLTEPQREVLARIARTQRHLRGLIEDVLGFAKLEVGQLGFHIEDVPLGARLAPLCEAVAAQFTDKRLAVEFTACEPRLMARADPDRLDQIVLNLLINAAKFTDDGGRVTLSAAAAEDDVEITVRDTGSGIPADKLEAIFEPFTQLPPGLDQRPSGVGLGLAISRDLARAMNGDITVSSVIGTGSIFIVRLPRGPMTAVGAEEQGRAETAPRLGV